MSLRDTIKADVITAMKAKEADKLEVLRFLQSAIKNKEIDQRPTELTEQDVLAVIKKLTKQRKDSIEQFQTAGRTDLVDRETFQLKLLETYMPEQMSEEKVAEVVTAAIAETGASSMKDMGKVMGLVKQKTDGAADNKLVSELIKKQLSN